MKRHAGAKVRSKRSAWAVAIAAFAVMVSDCSSRVPVKPAPSTEPDEETTEGAFEPTDAANGVSANDASRGSSTLDASLLPDAGEGPSATSASASTSTWSSTDTTSTSSATTDSESTSSAASTGVNPVPTRQLTVPLPTATVKFAIVVSVDGLAPRFVEALMSEGKAPTFEYLQTVAGWTHNARTDKTHTYTLPNHTSMLTGLPVQPVPGLASYRAHFYTANSDPAPNATLHQLRFPDHTYTPSMFDVAHDNGLATAMFASKSKFSLYSQTYNDAGGPDITGPDNGARKIDRVFFNVDPAAMVAELVTQLKTLPPHLTFVHLNQPDTAGHSYKWGSPEYLTAVTAMDALLGQLLSTIQQGQLEDRTALIITADHGGVDYSHLDPVDPLNYQIPFYVFAPGVAPGDLYASLEHRVAPGIDNPGYEELGQPIRNGDAGNLALDLLGLEPIPDSVIHSAGLLSAF